MDDESEGTPPRDDREMPSADEEARPPDSAGPEAGEDTAQTNVLPGDSGVAEDDTGETVAVPPADEPTRLMTGEAEAATRVLPPAGAASGSGAPPAPPQPTLMMSRPPSGSSGTLWIVVLVLLLALAAAAATWYFLIRDDGTPAPTPSPTPAQGFAWVGAWARTDGSGGGVVVQEGDGAYQVTVYDGMVQVIGSAPATERGEDLTLELQTDVALAGLPGPYQIELSPGDSADLLSMSVTGSNGTTVIVPLERVAVLVPVTPSASPSPSPPPTASPTTSPTATPSPSPTAADQQVITGIQRIQVGVITWATNNGNLYPVPAEVTETGAVAEYVDPWPSNPYTGQPMQPGTQSGDYTYEQLDGGGAYKLTGYVANGLTYTVP